MKTLFLFFLAIVTGSYAPAQAPAPKVPLEEPPTASAAQLLPPAVTSGTDYTIDPKVPTDGFVGIFQLHTRFGDYPCAGREMLFVRLQELPALEKIDKVSKTGAFVQAVAQGAIGDPVEAAAKIAVNPVGSVEKVPAGVARLFGKVIGGAADAGKSVGKMAGLGEKPKVAAGSKPPPSRDDPIGYNDARNKWARKFGIDPYTTNRPLALKLNHLGMISFSMDKIAGAGAGAVAGGLGPLAEYLSYLPDVDDHILTKPPADITKYNTRRLSGLGVSKEAMSPLLDNPWFSPTLQTRYVNALVSIKGASNAAAAVAPAGNAVSEEEARFLCGSLDLLAHNLDAVPHPLRLGAFGGLPAVTGADGTLLVAAPVDLLSWTDLTAGFAAQSKGSHATLCIAGPLTDRAKEGFASTGWQIRQLQR